MLLPRFSSFPPPMRKLVGGFWSPLLRAPIDPPAVASSQQRALFFSFQPGMLLPVFGSGRNPRASSSASDFPQFATRVDSAAQKSS